MDRCVEGVAHSDPPIIHRFGRGPYTNPRFAMWLSPPVLDPGLEAIRYRTRRRVLDEPAPSESPKAPPEGGKPLVRRFARFFRWDRAHWSACSLSALLGTRWRVRHPGSSRGSMSREGTVKVVQPARFCVVTDRCFHRARSAHKVPASYRGAGAPGGPCSMLGILMNVTSPRDRQAPRGPNESRSQEEGRKHKRRYTPPSACCCPSGREDGRATAVAALDRR